MTEVILCLSGFCHVTIFVLCNTATVHVVKIIHLSAELARCHIFRKDSYLLNEYDYFVCYHVTLSVIVLCNNDCKCCQDYGNAVNFKHTLG